MNKLEQTPQPHGLETEYACGLVVRGRWASRLKKHKKFTETDAGKYILKLENQLKNLFDFYCPNCQGTSQSSECENPSCPDQPCCGKPKEDCKCNLVMATYKFPNGNVATFGYDKVSIPALQGIFTEELYNKIKQRSDDKTSWNGF